MKNFNFGPIRIPEGQFWPIFAISGSKMTFFECRNCLFSELNQYIMALDIYRLDNYMQNGSKEHDMNGILGVQLATCVIFISNESSIWMFAAQNRLKHENEPISSKNGQFWAKIGSKMDRFGLKFSRNGTEKRWPCSKWDLVIENEIFFGRRIKIAQKFWNFWKNDRLSKKSDSPV